MAYRSIDQAQPEAHRRKSMKYVVITLTPEIFTLKPVVHGPFETWDEAEEFLENWIELHPGTRGIIRSLTCPQEPPSNYLHKKRNSVPLEAKYVSISKSGASG